MLKKEMDKQTDLIDRVKALWEGGHGEEITEAYNEIVEILNMLDVYSANMLVNLLWLQTAQKTLAATVGKKEGVKE